MADVDMDPRKAPIVKLKTFLTANGVPFDPNMSSKGLRLLCKRRILRLKHFQAERPLQGVHASESLAQYKARITKMVDNNFGPKVFPSFNCKLLWIEPDVTIIRHSKLCRGVITGGMCNARECKEADRNSDGEHAFNITMVLCDLEDSTELLNLKGYAKTGSIIFEKTAADVAAMTDDERADILEKWSEVALNVSVHLEYNIAKGTADGWPYNLVRLPDDYLTEYS